MTSSANVTHYALSLGDLDPVTGWHAQNFSAGTIKMVIRPRGATIPQLGFIARYDLTGLTADVVDEGDVIKDAFDSYYVLRSAQLESWLDSPSHYVCDLVKRDFAEEPATSGTWHLDSESLITDPRYRHKVYLEDYLTDSHLKENNGSTNASYGIAFDPVPYPLKFRFINKAEDLLFCIGKEDTKPRLNYLHYPYAFEETVPITVYAVNKTGITAANLVEQAEQELRRIVTEHPLGSIRTFESIKHKPVDLGSTFLHSSTATIRYVRPNDDYLPSYPTVSFPANGFQYECDRLSGGAEGTWSLTDGGSTVTQAIDSENNLDLDLTAYVADAYTANDTDLGLSTTVYPRIRFAYKTTGDAYAKIIIVFSDATLQTALAATSSTTWTVGDVALTEGKTVDHIHFYAATGVGHVYYDFVQIYKGTYTFPNVVAMTRPFLVNDANIEIPGRFGSIDQPLGTKSLEVTLTCDLDMEPASLTWKRPQTTTPKTDYNNDDILMELAHYRTDLWHWLNLGDPSVQMKARLVEMRPALSGESNQVELVFREFAHGSAEEKTAVERWALDQ